MYGHILIAGCRFELLGKPRCFQSTRPRGARRIRRDLRVGLGEFQSTRPRGARHAVACAPEFDS